MEKLQIQSDQLDYKSNKTASPLEDKPFSEISGQIPAEQDFRILRDGDLEDLYSIVRVMESLAEELEAAVKGSSTSERLAENEVSLTGCENWTAHVSLDRKGLWMTNDIILDEINNIQDNKEEFNDRFQMHPIECIESIPGKDDRSVKCSLCDETCSSKLSYQIHIRKFHYKMNRNTLTSKKTFHCSDNLKCHLGTHPGERPYKCQYCEKRFIWHSNLSCHIPTHIRERAFKCSFCEKTFTQQSTMNQHIRIHTERPFKCSFCEKTFKRHTNLSRHIRTHTGERPFQCSFCEKTFAERSNMNQHIQTHTGERSFKCLFCQKTFIHNSNLSRHILTHKGEQPHKCSLCEKTFTQHSDMNRHIRTHTRQMYPL